ncbi:hypothetical protein CDV36_000990 [Fusarium kuroshium]|uniref:Neutral protease 2 n=2 Tax=Fusarium solani species complex TaxID=232080 RepID=A0A3M2SP85_9HYPO|nr:hypothetical protein CDV36_000990 [Fusarium kuroshium]RSL93481.1 hypothetical protein CEP52_013245 [Fusarium oligoseptatum]
MLFSQALASAVFLAIGAESHAPVNARSAETAGLAVTLSSSSGKATEVEVTIKNGGSNELSLLRVGTILDERPVQKLVVVDGAGEKLPFQGIDLSVYYEGLESKHYEKLAAGSSITRLVDLSSVYDFKPGTYSIFAEGTLPSVSGASKEPNSISFKSESLSITVKETSSAEVKQTLSERSLVITEDCPADKLKANLDGVRNCETLARAAAADAADVNSARFVEYFKSNETEAREHVSGRLLAVAKECSTTDSGDTRVLCRDDLNVCETDGPLIAYTTWVNGYIVMCPLFYDTLPPLPQKCHKQDHATTTIHEMTHARAVFEDQAPATADRAYGYENSTALSSVDAMYNADSYSLYANAVYMDC